MYFVRVLIILILFVLQSISSKVIRLKDGEITYEYDDSSTPLGEGAFGRVFEGVRIIGNQTESVAFKELRPKKPKKELLKEKKIYDMIGHHDSIPRYYHYFPGTKKTKPVFVMERMGRTLFSLWDEFRPFSSITAMQVGLQILDVLEWMHSNGVTHNDLHYRNIAVDFKNKSKIYLFDFSHAEEIKAKPTLDLEHVSQVLSAITSPSAYERTIAWSTKIYLRNEVLKEFRLIADKYRSINDDRFRNETFDKLKNILRTELKKHENEAGYKTFDIGYIQDSADGMSLLRKFIRQNDSSAIIKQIQSDQELNVDTEFGDALHHYKPIHLAAELSNAAVVRTLIENGAEINSKFNEISPLHYAAFYGNVDAVKILIGHGANINAEDYYGEISLCTAMTSGKHDVIRILMENGADVNAKCFLLGKTQVDKANSYGFSYGNCSISLSYLTTFAFW